MAIEHVPTRSSFAGIASLGRHDLPTGGALLPREVMRFDPVGDTQSTFRVILSAMAHPGSVRQLPVACAGAPLNEWIAAVLLTLLDHETTLHVGLPATDGVGHPLAQYVMVRTGARAADARVADIVVGTGADGDLLGSLQRGTLAYPDTGASLVVPVGSLGEDGSGDGLRLQISGPGVPVGHSFLASDIEPSWVARRTEVVAGYPVGVDIYLVDSRGRIVCLPRSSSLGVLETETDGKSPSEVH